MAGRGPVPSGRSTRRGQPELPGEDLGPAVGVAAAPPLPDADTYTEATREWYRTWCESPQTSKFVATDWQRLQMLAPVIDALASRDLGIRERLAALAEVRQNEKLLGGTVADRLALRWRVPKTPGQGEGEGDSGDAGQRPGASSRERPDPRAQ